MLLWKIIIESLKAVRDFNRGDFVLEYAGELLHIKKVQVGKDLEQEAMNVSKGCFHYYFRHNEKQYW